MAWRNKKYMSNKYEGTAQAGVEIDGSLRREAKMSPQIEALLKNVDNQVSFEEAQSELGAIPDYERNLHEILNQMGY